ncbi:unnamed protein product [Auanema sp. JU1783]|nr:unnamed protein product [Auanema sp. JU1783]
MKALLAFVISAVVFHYGESAIFGEWDDVNRDDFEPDKGFLCADKYVSPSLKWFVDYYREKVYPFWYLGCGNTENIYDSIPEAEKSLPSDSAQCDGFNMTGWPTYGPSSDESDYKCPDGSSYLPYGEFSAICCDDATAERYRQSKHVKCPNNEDLMTIEIVHMDKEFEDVVSFRENRTLFGKSCEHNFCPQNFRCLQGEFEAYCCPDDPASAFTNSLSDSNAKKAISRTSGDGIVNWLKRQLIESSLIIRFIFVTLAIFVFVISLLICIVCRTNRSRRPLLHQKYGDAKETMTLNP